MANNMDVLTPAQRHKNMKRIKSADTKAEVFLRRKLWNSGIRYRKNLKTLPGKPDIVLTKYKLCVFVDSEFFHGKGFEGGYESKKYDSLREQLQHSNNSAFWLEKIRKNMERDRSVNQTLAEMGWTVIRFWSKEVIKDPDHCLKVIKETILEQSL